MSKRNIWRALVGTTVLTAALTACGGPTESSGPAQQGSTDRIVEMQVDLNDGRTVTCVGYDGHREAAMSCDWGNAA